MFNLKKNIGKHYNCLWSGHGNVIRNADGYDILKIKTTTKKSELFL